MVDKADTRLTGPVPVAVAKSQFRGMFLHSVHFVLESDPARVFKGRGNMLGAET